MSESQTFALGELVDITVRGVRVVNSYPETRLTEDGPATRSMLVVRHADHQGQSIAVDVTNPSVTVERVAPADWPPQPGDAWHVWRRYSDGSDATRETWLASVERDRDWRPGDEMPPIVLIPARRPNMAGGYIYPEDLLRIGQPSLAYRDERDQSGGGDQ